MGNRVRGRKSDDRRQRTDYDFYDFYGFYDFYDLYKFNDFSDLLLTARRLPLTDMGFRI